VAANFFADQQSQKYENLATVSVIDSGILPNILSKKVLNEKTPQKGANNKVKSYKLVFIGSSFFRFLNSLISSTRFLIIELLVTKTDYMTS
jgi:hypothetical protein